MSRLNDLGIKFLVLLYSLLNGEINIKIFHISKKEIDKEVSNIIINLVKVKPDCVLGLATGSTPIGVYERLIEEYKSGNISFNKVTTFNLDEYLNIENDYEILYFKAESLYELQEYADAEETYQKIIKENSIYLDKIKDHYIDCLILIVNGYTLKNDVENALLYIDECRRLTKTMSLNSLCSFYTSYLTYLIKCGTKQSIKDVIKECILYILD